MIIQIYNKKIEMFHEENDTHIESSFCYINKENCYYEKIMNILLSSAHLKKSGIKAFLFIE